MQSLASRTEMRTPLGALARKPLYLSASTRARITAKGAAIVVRQAPAGIYRYPVARLDRIICSRYVDWTGEAFALCLSNNITITLLDGRGAAIGSASPRLPHSVAFHSALEMWLEHADWTFRYENWLRKRRMNVLFQSTTRVVAAGRPFCRETFEKQKREYVYNGEITAAFAPIGQSWSHALVLSRLAREGLEPRYFGYDGHPLELAEDLSCLLWAELNLDCGSLPIEADSERTQMKFFESWARERHDRLEAHLANLKLHVARENKDWP
jgi:hypothetical protein